MWKWSRARLVLSIVMCEGLFATLRERLQYGPGKSRRKRSAGEIANGNNPMVALPRSYDYAGAVHIHSTYSDGAGTMAEIAQAANTAGLDFVVMCDHANLDARRNGEGGWQGRTLFLIGTEVTTNGGHLLALGVPDSFLPAPGDAVAAQESILKSGGVGYVALPCDLKDHWRDFSRLQPGIGLEVFNLSAIARTKINLPALAMVWSRYKSRKPQSAFHLVASRPDREIRLWDSLTSPASAEQPARHVAAIGSLDAHAVMKFGGRSFPYPTYEELFRTLRTHVVTSVPLDGAKSEADSQIIHEALERGRCYMAYDNFGDSTGFVFEAAPVASGQPATMGDSIEFACGPTGAQLKLIVRVPRSRSLIRLYRNGRLIAAARCGHIEYMVSSPGVYRAEVFVYRRRIGSVCLGSKPWIFSNPIYIQPASVGVSNTNARDRRPVSA